MAISFKVRSKPPVTKKEEDQKLRTLHFPCHSWLLDALQRLAVSKRALFEVSRYKNMEGRCMVS